MDLGNPFACGRFGCDFARASLVRPRPPLWARRRRRRCILSLEKLAALYRAVEADGDGQFLCLVHTAWALDRWSRARCSRRACVGLCKALLILLAAAWITTGANATSEGERAPGLANKRFVSSHLDAAVRPATDDAFALVRPEVNAKTMDVFLDRFAACLAQNTQAIVLLDQAGWHGKKAPAVPVGGAINSVKSARVPSSS